MATVAERIAAVMQQFLSETATRVVMRAAIGDRKLPATMTSQETAALINSILLTGNGFVARDRQAAFKAALYALTDAGGLQRASFTIRTEADASQARLAARTLTDRAGGGALACQQVATIVSELARNQISYAGGGEVVLAVENTPRKQITIRAQDKGPGIPNLAIILSGTYKSKTGMGLGLLGTKRMANRFDVQTGITGTTVEAVVWL